MEPFGDMTLSQLLQKGGYDCDCGRRHASAVQDVRIGAGVVETLPEVLRHAGISRPLILDDPDTYRAAGARVQAILEKAGIPFTEYRLPMGHPEPDDSSVGAAAMHFPPECDGILSVGSGVLNDIGKILSGISGKPQVLAGTAPSMDGYVSDSASMVTEGIKVSISTPCPVAVVADTDILAAAPMRMLQAGVGDMAAKYISICEWRISHIVTGEYYCPRVAELMRTTLAGIMSQTEGVAKRDPEAIGKVAQGLICSGIAMAYAQVTRPASGIEHYFSHVWEMMAIEKGEKSDLHGIQVGVGTLLGLKMYEWLAEEKPDAARAKAAMEHFDDGVWRAEVRRIFGSSAERIFALEAETHKNSAARQAAHFEKIQAHWPEILEIIQEELPTYQGLLNVMQALKMPVTPGEIGVSVQQAADGLVGSRDIRDKYMICGLLWDMGLLETYKERLTAFLTNPSAV